MRRRRAKSGGAPSRASGPCLPQIPSANCCYRSGLLRVNFHAVGSELKAHGSVVRLVAEQVVG
jgi:hypothetical protein